MRLPDDASVRSFGEIGLGSLVVGEFAPDDRFFAIRADRPDQAGGTAPYLVMLKARIEESGLPYLLEAHAAPPTMLDLGLGYVVDVPIDGTHPAFSAGELAPIVLHGGEFLIRLQRHDGFVNLATGMHVAWLDEADLAMWTDFALAIPQPDGSLARVFSWQRPSD